jgi:hypothetical protein
VAPRRRCAAAPNIASGGAICEDARGMRSSALRIVGLVLVASAACGHDAHRSRKPGSGAVLTGHVRLAEGAELPAYAALDLVRTVLPGPPPAGLPAECAAANRAALSPVKRAEAGALSGIVVAASDFTRFTEREPEARRVAIAGCALQPQVIAAMEGDMLTLENRDAFAFETLLGPGFRAQPLARGERLMMPLKHGVEFIACSPRAPCGRTDVVVFRHPLFSVTDAHGGFRIENFPVNEMVRIDAWHPLFEENDTYVWLEPSAHVEIELVMTPKPRFVPPPKATARQ